jgi:CRISPR-associated protein Cas1
MYAMRFPNEDVSGLSMQQLRGREGVRVRRIYKEWSEKTGIAWDKRTYNPNDFEDATEINKALSASHTCMYGLAHSAIVALGCSPGLGFVHTGHEKSFVYDIADLYKAEISIPVAFQTAAEHPDDIGAETRRNMRDAVFDLKIMGRMVDDIKMLLGEDDAELSPENDHVGLWDDKVGEVPAGKGY